ncbi:MAG: hypothetical protein ACJ72L_21820 [Marmoricola sp.]
MEYERVGRVRMVWRMVREFLVDLVTMSWVQGDDLKVFSDVVVFRRDTGGTVAAYPYDYLGEAKTHVESLLERLESTQIFDFCRDLGISIDAIAGEGDLEGGALPVTWTPISARARGASWA